MAAAEEMEDGFFVEELNLEDLNVNLEEELSDQHGLASLEGLDLPPSVFASELGGTQLNPDELLAYASNEVEFDCLSLPQLDQEGTDQTDGHQGASQADTSIENAVVPNTSGTLLDPHGTQLLEISTANSDAPKSSSSGGKLRSKFWKEFDILEYHKINGAPVRAKCKHCNTELGCPTKQGTGVLQNHLRSKACPYAPSSTAGATTNPATGESSSSRKRKKAITNPRSKDDSSKKIWDILGVHLQDLCCGIDNNGGEERYCFTLRQIDTLLDEKERS